MFCDEGFGLVRQLKKAKLLRTGHLDAAYGYWANKVLVEVPCVPYAVSGAGVSVDAQAMTKTEFEAATLRWQHQAGIARFRLGAQWFEFDRIAKRVVNVGVIALLQIEHISLN